MILDSSAIVSMVAKEEGHRRLLETLGVASNVAVGSPTLFETAIVLIARDGDAGRIALEAFLRDNEVVTVPFDERHLSVAADAFLRYGKGRHPACLNYGDCMTYATARLAGLPLLYVGDDFAKTDLAAALPR